MNYEREVIEFTSKRNEEKKSKKSLSEVSKTVLSI
jgi:hypothetical protein